MVADSNRNGLRDFNEPIVRDFGLSPNVSSVLPAGSYLLEVPLATVFSSDPADISHPFVPFEYDANLLVSPVADLPADNAGNSIASARDLGTLTTAQTFNDALGLFDKTDLYRFTLDAPTNFEAIVENTDRNFSGNS